MLLRSSKHEGLPAGTSLVTDSKSVLCPRYQGVILQRQAWFEDSTSEGGINPDGICGAGRHRVNSPCSSQSRLLMAAQGADSPSLETAVAPAPLAQDRAAAQGQAALLTCGQSQPTCGQSILSSHLCTAGCSMSLALVLGTHHQSMGSYTELCCCRAA